jgi:hypothetical protein
MTYIAALDPNRVPDETLEATWDALMPDWREREVPFEARALVSETDVHDAQHGIVTGYGGDHRRLIPGVDEPGF